MNVNKKDEHELLQIDGGRHTENEVEKDQLVMKKEIGRRVGIVSTSKIIKVGSGWAQHAFCRTYGVGLDEPCHPLFD